MCCCGKPTINGQPGYSWDGKSFSVRAVAPPDLMEGDELLYDEPGRCGGLDCHSYHFRIVKRGYYRVLLVRHGGGDESVDLGSVAKFMLPSMDAMDSNARYWLMHTIYSAQRDAADRAYVNLQQHDHRPLSDLSLSVDHQKRTHQPRLTLYARARDKGRRNAVP